MIWSRILATFSANIEKNAPLKKKTHLFQIYNSISLKKKCVFFLRRCVFFFLHFGKTHLMEKNAPFILKKTHLLRTSVVELPFSHQRYGWFLKRIWAIWINLLDSGSEAKLTTRIYKVDSDRPISVQESDCSRGITLLPQKMEHPFRVVSFGPTQNGWRSLVRTFREDST